MTTETLPYPTLIHALRAAAVKFGQLFVTKPEHSHECETDVPQVPDELQFNVPKIPAKFASSGDVATRHVTLNISDLVRAGFFGKPHNLVQGDRIQSFVNGIYTVWKVNRKNARTAAAKLDRILELPRIDAEGYHTLLYDIEIVGIHSVN